MVALTLFYETSEQLEYRVRMSLKEIPLSVGEARAIQTAHDKIKWLIVAPTVHFS